MVARASEKTEPEEHLTIHNGEESKPEPSREFNVLRYGRWYRGPKEETLTGRWKQAAKFFQPRFEEGDWEERKLSMIPVCGKLEGQCTCYKGLKERGY